MSVDFELRHSGYRNIVQQIDSYVLSPQYSLSPQDLRRARRYARRIQEASCVHLVKARCLHRSLVLHKWLRSEGLLSELQIGVLKNDGKFMAHAWVTLGGHVVNDATNTVVPFTPLKTISGDHQGVDFLNEQFQPSQFSS